MVTAPSRRARDDLLTPRPDPTPRTRAAAEAVEEAIINALLAGEDMCSDDGRRVDGLKPELLLPALRASGWSSPDL